MRRLYLLALALAGGTSTGCDFDVKLDQKQLDQITGTIDNFKAQIGRTTTPGGDLWQLVDHTSGELKAAIREAKEAGKEITADFFLKFAAERERTISEIRRLSKEVFGDANILLRELQGIGLSIPLQFEDGLKRFSKDFAQEMKSMLTATPFVGDHPVDIEGLVWSARSTGYQTMVFTVKQAHNLQLKIGDVLYSPKFGGKAGSATYEIPVSALAKKFHDTESYQVGFGLFERNDLKAVDLPVQVPLVGSGQVGVLPARKKGAERLAVGGGWVQVVPRFPLEYDLQLFPADGSAGRAGHIGGGTGIKNLLEGLDGEPVAVATRRGELFWLTKSRLPVGTSEAELPKGASWTLKVKAGGHEWQTLSPNKRRVETPFGSVTVQGPEAQAGKWLLLIDVDIKK